MRRNHFSLLNCFGGLLTLAATFSAPSASAQLVGRIDNFEDGTTQNWIAGALGAPNPNPPINVATGGPGGADDNYLLLTSNGRQGPGSRLTAQNFAQWAGNYTAENVIALAMDVNNLGATDLSLRLFLGDPGAGPPSNIALSLNPVTVTAGSGWQSVLFSLTPDALVAGLGTVEGALSGATELRIYHSPDLGFPGPPSAAQLGIDNIRVAAVPEPSALLAFALGCGGLAWKARGRRKW